MTVQFPTMIADNLDTLNGDMESPEWIVRNVVIDLAGYQAHIFANHAIINDNDMTYSIMVKSEYADDITNMSGRIIGTNEIVLTYQRIWSVMNKIARTKHTIWDTDASTARNIRTAVFESDGSDLDSIDSIAIIECAIFGKVMF